MIRLGRAELIIRASFCKVGQFKVPRTYCCVRTLCKVVHFKVPRTYCCVCLTSYISSLPCATLFVWSITCTKTGIVYHTLQKVLISITLVSLVQPQALPNVG